MTKQSTYYVCLGTPEQHLDALTEDARCRKFTDWTINSQAKIGDRVLFYMKAPVSSLVAVGTVLTNAKRNTDDADSWRNYFMSYIGDIDMLPAPIPVSVLRLQFPEWKYFQRPQKSAHVPESLVQKLEHVLRLSDRRLTGNYLQGRSQKITVAMDSQSSGKLKCERCGRDLRAARGDLGKGYCEADHLTPEGFVILCSNCYDVSSPRTSEHR